MTADGRWWLPFRSFAIRAGDGPVTLVDAGIGPADSPAAGLGAGARPAARPNSPRPASTRPTYARSCSPTCTPTTSAGRSPATGHAVLPQCRLPAAAGRTGRRGAPQPGLSAGLIAPLRAAGQLGWSTATDRLDPAVRLLPTPGHTPGHQSVLVEVGDETAAGHRGPAGARRATGRPRAGVRPRGGRRTRRVPPGWRCCATWPRAAPRCWPPRTWASRSCRCRPGRRRRGTPADRCAPFDGTDQMEATSACLARTASAASLRAASSASVSGGLDDLA